EKIKLPAGHDVLAYIRELWENEITPGVREISQVQRMKKFMNFIGEGVASPEKFLHDIRRVETTADFWRVCENFLDHDEPMTLEPGAPAG
ncbi:MAG TPA: tRNA-dihydrouridine synthase family protein, partial [Verrucomicrobiae bacterium]